MKSDYPAGMPARDVCAIVTAVADALDYAHQRGLLHRDVKPANILLTFPDDGQRRILLADFGIARQLRDTSGLTATNFTVGTVAYASPEQLMGSHIDGRTDQYALAATAFHLLTGEQPFPHSNPIAVISQHLNAPPPSIGERRPDLAHLDQVFATALAKTPPTGSHDAVTSSRPSTNGPPPKRSMTTAPGPAPHSPPRWRGWPRRLPPSAPAHRPQPVQRRRTMTTTPRRARNQLRLRRNKRTGCRGFSSGRRPQR